jgi:hypothetical protein
MAPEIVALAPGPKLTITVRLRDEKTRLVHNLSLYPFTPSAFADFL